MKFVEGVRHVESLCFLYKVCVVFLAVDDGNNTACDSPKYSVHVLNPQVNNCYVKRDTGKGCKQK